MLDIKAYAITPQEAWDTAFGKFVRATTKGIPELAAPQIEGTTE